MRSNGGAWYGNALGRKNGFVGERTAEDVAGAEREVAGGCAHPAIRAAATRQKRTRDIFGLSGRGRVDESWPNGATNVLPHKLSQGNETHGASRDMVVLAI